NVIGKSFRYTDLSYSDVEELPDPLPPFDPSGLVPVSLLSDGKVRAGVTFGNPESGITKTTRAGVPAAILTDAAGNPRFPTRGGTPLAGGIELTATEVDALLDSVIFTANRTRAQIRNPRNTPAQVSIWIVDTEGVVLGQVRTGDGPVFGLDVALQKARTATFFSSVDAGDRLDDVRARNAVGDFDDYVGQVRAFLGDEALRGFHAFADRSGGNLSRPFFPDGINDKSNGPLSHPFPGSSAAVPGVRTWSPFNTGLQLDLVFQRLVQPLGIPVSPPTAVPDSCTDSSVLGSRLRNGIQIFPGSVPLYRNGTLIGGVGISGDGVDQDDLICFYGVSRKGLDAIGRTDVGDPVLGFNAPPEIRADNIVGPIDNTRLRFVNCPESPFLGSSEQQVCGGL
ncbi:MAG: heme-binding protein, partial [Bdellovibrionales bacterium]|nr:heme-binding protein [Bdellovibrionales bacterium]